MEGLQQPVPDVGGLSVEAARAQLEALGFGVSISGYVRSEYPVDTVAYTFPAAGESLGSGDTVTIYQSDGTPPKGSGGGDDGDGGGGGDGGDDGDGPGNGNGNGNGNGRTASTQLSEELSGQLGATT